MYSDLWKNDSQGKQVRARGAAGEGRAHQGHTLRQGLQLLQPGSCLLPPGPTAEAAWIPVKELVLSSGQSAGNIIAWWFWLPAHKAKWTGVGYGR